MNQFKPEAHTYRTTAMREVLQLVGRGYVRHISGKTERRLAQLEALKHHGYGAFMTPQQRWRSRQKGAAGVRSVYLIEDEMVHFWVLATADGGGLLVELEGLKDARKRNQRMKFADYELVRYTRKNDTEPRWTWELTEQAYTRWSDTFQRVIRMKKDLELKQMMHSLRRVPSFSGIRKQAYKLSNQAKAEWVRSRKGDFPESFYLGWQGRYKKADLIKL